MMGDTAETFARARGDAAGLPVWPGAFPPSLEAAYAMQQALGLAWGKASGGVKVGRVLGEWAERFGVDRFSGPVDADAIAQAAPGQEMVFPVIPGGTALLECEIVAVLGRDAPEGPMSAHEARELVADLHIGIEIAGSPMAGVNALGPLASIACFGKTMVPFWARSSKAGARWTSPPSPAPRASTERWPGRVTHRGCRAGFSPLWPLPLRGARPSASLCTPDRSSAPER